MNAKNGVQVADIIGNMQQDHSVKGVPVRRRMEADLIRKERF